MTTTEELQNMEGQTAVDVNGAKLGKIGQIYVDDQTGQPLWVTITTGMFGTKQSFAPLHGSRSGRRRPAPRRDQGHGHRRPRRRGRRPHRGLREPGPVHLLRRVPRRQWAGPVRAAYAGDTRQDLAGRDRIQGHDTSGPATDDAMTRSEERLHVGTEQADAGRARLRKYVVTENVTQTVPVSHEEVRLEREPVTDANRGAATSGSDISEEEHEVTLRAERPVVNKETVPVERVRLGTETVTEDHEVSETLRKEQIDDPDVNTTGTTR